jgi:hypothetical protein
MSASSGQMSSCEDPRKKMRLKGKKPNTAGIHWLLYNVFKDDICCNTIMEV